MRFWDSSAVVPLILAEPESGRIESMARDDSAMVAWWGTRVECVSALRRGERTESLQPVQVAAGLELLAELSRAWAEILPSDRVRGQAERLLAVHSLRAPDALQLAAGIIWCDGHPEGAAFTCLDERLGLAAQREGFTVLPADS